MNRFFTLLITLFILNFSSNLNSQNNDHYTIIVSLDGFRWDYPQIHGTPYLDKMAQKGVSAVMRPSYPASTFPNHYTLITGLVPDHNGIINNVKGRKEIYLVPDANHTPYKENRTPTLVITVEFIDSL